MSIARLKLFLLLFSLLPIAAHSLELVGVGRHVPSQLFDDWAKQFSAQNETITIKYQITSPADIVKLIEEDRADFADTDTPFSKSELDAKGITQFPYMFTAITPVINIPGIFTSQLRLDGSTLAAIYLGKITRWNDPALVALNPKLQLPDEAIQVVHGNAQASGTFPISNYLSKVSSEWKSKVGDGAVVNWPTGTALPSELGIGDFVKNTPYSIGYTEISYARKHNINYVQMQNKDGRFVSPHTGSVESSLQLVKWKSSNGFCEDTADAGGFNSWPIVSVSYLIINKTSKDIPRRLSLLKFISWDIGQGDIIATNLDFMPINRSILPLIRGAWNDTPLTIEGGVVVDAKQVNEMRSGKVLIVDARVAREYEESHIPGALSIPYAEKSEKSANFNPQADQ